MASDIRKSKLVKEMAIGVLCKMKDLKMSKEKLVSTDGECSY